MGRRGGMKMSIVPRKSLDSEMESMGEGIVKSNRCSTVFLLGEGCVCATDVVQRATGGEQGGGGLVFDVAV